MELLKSQESECPPLHFPSAAYYQSQFLILGNFATGFRTGEKDLEDGKARLKR